MNAAVGTRSSSVCDPHTVTPLIDCKPVEQQGEHLGLGGGDAIHAFFDQESSCGLDAGDALEVGHARLEPSGP